MSSISTYCIDCSIEEGEPVKAGEMEMDRDALKEEHDLDKSDRYILLNHDKCGNRSINPMMEEQDIAQLITAHNRMDQAHRGNGDLKINQFGGKKA